MFTPRPYLSWSSMDLLERDQEKWKQLYLYGQEMRPNRGMEFGKKMADGLENDEMTGDLVLDLVMEVIPKFELMDVSMIVELKRGKKVYPILIKPDTMKEDLSAFKEYKTGQAKWTQKRFDELGQITFYATGMYLKTGKAPQDIEGVWIPSIKDDPDNKFSEVKAVGDVYVFKTKRSMAEILKMMIRMTKAWELINKICEEELL